MSHPHPPRSPAAAPSPQELTTVELIDRLSSQVSTLVRTEIANAVGEIKTKSGRLGVGIGLSGIGTLLLLYGVATLIATAVLAVATLVQPWLAGLLVAVVVIGAGAVLVGIGASRAKSAAPPVPANTAASIRKDVTIVKDHF